MPYATRQDMIEAFGSDEVLAITDRDRNGAIDDVVLGRALAAADRVINAYLQGRYALPLASISELLVDLACDIARYKLVGSSALETEAIRNRYKDAKAFLKEVASGDASLGITQSGQPARAADTVTMQSAGSVFSREERGL